MTDAYPGRNDGGTVSAAPARPQDGPEAVAGPFTLREVVLGASVLMIFIGSLLPFLQRNGQYGNLWNAYSLFFVGIGIVLPIAAAAMLAAQRLGQARLRVGSLSVDQFASVTAALATAFFFLQTVSRFNIGPLVALFGSLGLLAATVLAPHVPFFRADFAGRPEMPAHVVARRAVPARPRAPKPVPAEQVRHWHDPHFAVQGPSATVDPASPAGSMSAPPIDATVPLDEAALAGAGGPSAPAPDAGPAAASDRIATGSDTAGDGAEGRPAAVHGSPDQASAGRALQDQDVVEAFWFAVGTRRPVVEERTGQQLFVLEPGNWEVGIEDRGHEFLVQDKRTGQVGVMRDLSNIERAPRERA